MPLEKQTTAALGISAKALVDIFTVVPVKELTVAPDGILDAAGPPIAIPFNTPDTNAKFSTLFPMAVVLLVLMVIALVSFQLAGRPAPTPLKSWVTGVPLESEIWALAWLENPEIANIIKRKPIHLGA